MIQARSIMKCTGTGWEAGALGPARPPSRLLQAFRPPLGRGTAQRHRRNQGRPRAAPSFIQGIPCSLPAGCALAAGSAVLLTPPAAPSLPTPPPHSHQARCEPRLHSSCSTEKNSRSRSGAAKLTKGPVAPPLPLSKPHMWSLIYQDRDL